MSLGAYVYLAYAYEQKIKINAWLIYTINALEDAFAAMLLVVMLTLVMHYSRKNYAGTDLLSGFGHGNGKWWALYFEWCYWRCTWLFPLFDSYCHYCCTILIPIYVWKATKTV